LVKLGEGATSVAEDDIIKENSRHSIEFVRSVYLITVVNTCIHGFNTRRGPIIGSSLKTRGVYQLLMIGGWKTGCAIWISW